MPEKQALREPADRGIVFVGELANRKKHLVLLRFEAGGFGGVIAAAEELADTIAQFGQCGVFGVADLSSHFLNYIALRYKCKRKLRHPVSGIPVRLCAHPIK